ncbi:ABC transporter ATP-binding protein [Aquisalimonas lutea]|uniref:ABC transporter ATP-binding protein n=1 Tax=Aquisalimonas lutea TaxID=1327750 RepID=UPI0025B428A5|nr:ABC transporter ATP-binding protein [Aquisalimonas lutea]MDN3516830.1 ABC transporter ATP-binding protein [Aquisalimonas lutea]
MTAEVLLETTGLARAFGPHAAVRGIDLRVGRGECLALLGLNGAGKTTTLEMLCGVLAPGAGTIRVAGHDLLAEPRAARQCLGYLPETPPLQPDARVIDYLHWAAVVRRIPRSRRRHLVERTLERCCLGGVRRRVIRNLSRGYQQRLGIAQAIVHQPPLVVLDEPTVGLDPRQVQGVRALIGDLRRDHGVILSTHVLADVEAACDRVAILHDGRIIHEQAVAPAADGDRRYRLRFDRPPRPDAVQALDGVLAAEAEGEQSLRVVVRDEAALDGIVAQAAHGGWRLRELAREVRTLEQVFLACTAPRPEEAA